ncbi:MAG TPA: dynamin family protein [Usitatibacter sp.]|nr:dynamin family protein [Usitatibacter sp.]
MESSALQNRFETEIARYNRWREELTQSVHAYHEWLEANGQLDVQQSIRFYDLLENLNKGRLMLAFLAEFSRGKSELINALFFASFKERLLPSDVGRTTMCPTEIFHDPSEEPYLKLLSVETRYRDESISQLKNMPVEWSKIRLNTGSAADMKQALKALADTKKVYALEARMLGLTPMLDENGELPGEEELVEVPAWRYAMINYPHPLLTNGLSILDTPGLNALGMEPELTVSTVPSAHAILFLLSIDTGVTRSDLEIWDRYVRPGLPQKVAVLNKIDLMWDELKTGAEVDKAIARMIDTTAQHLQLPRERIFALSAQKALLAKVRDDAELLDRSGIQALERYLAEDVVPMKRQILCRAVVAEIGGMMASSRASVAKKQQANQAEIGELTGLVGKSRDVVTKLWGRITSEKNAYNAALAEFKVNQQQFGARRTAIMEMLNPQKLDAMLGSSATAMEDSWTTMGLQRGMRELTRLMSENFEAVFAASEDLKKMMQGVYDTFIRKFAFQPMTLPTLDLDPHRTKLKLLVHETEAFAKDPVNVAHYKGPLVKKFYGTLVKQARTTFSDAKSQTERWIQAVTLPLEVQIKDHKAQLQSRLDNLAKINEKTTTINEQMATLRQVEAELAKQRQMIDGLVARVSVHEAKASLAVDIPPSVARRELAEPIELMAGAVAAQARAATPKPAAPKPSAPAAAPMVSDDLLAQFAAKPQPAFDPMKTQKLEPESERTQRIDPPRVARSPDGDSTVQIPKLDPNYRPDATQPMESAGEPGAEATQRLDDSIWRLQEAKRILQGIGKK